jgi:hypothetical protein
MSAELMTDAIIGYMPPLNEQAAKDAQRASVLAFCKGIIDHIHAAAQVNGAAAVGLTTAVGGGPVTGAVILPPGSIL